MNTNDLERVVVQHLNYRRNLIVPNVYWGWGLNYEADLVMVTKAGYAYEIELKVSKSDLRADSRKRHCHNAKVFRGLWFAMPEQVYDPELVPERAGVITVRENQYHRYIPDVVRKPKPTKADKISDAKRLKLLELMAMRIWDLKDALCRLRENDGNDEVFAQEVLL